MKKMYVLKNNERFSMFIIVAMLTASSIIFANMAYGYRDSECVVVSVKQGDTLWGLSKQYCKGNDIRKYIYEVKRLNNLKGSEIYMGIDLKLPTQ